MALHRSRTQFPADVYATRVALCALAGLYVAGCAFRSVLPMIDVPRLCLHDTGLSYVVVGRSVATVAELAFACQFALLLREAGAIRAARLVVPIIVVAEVCSWLAVLTTDNLLHFAENSLWTLTAALVLAALATRWRRVAAQGQRVITAAMVLGAGYIAFMVLIDLPMYLSRWDPTQEPLSLRAGMSEITRRCIVDHDWNAWREDAVWLTLYFTVAVWISIALTRLPPLHGRQLLGQREVDRTEYRAVR